MMIVATIPSKQASKQTRLNSAFFLSETKPDTFSRHILSVSKRVGYAFLYCLSDSKKFLSGLLTVQKIMRAGMENTVCFEIEEKVVDS